MKKIAYVASVILLIVAGCQKMDRPALGDYPQDANPPGGPLKFFIAGDGDGTDSLRAGVDSIRANFPIENPFNTIEGIKGKGLEGVSQGIMKYANSNDFAASGSFTISFWEKHDGHPVGDAQFLFSIPSNAGHWSEGTMFLIFDHEGAGATRDSAVIKFMIFDQVGENWFELTGNNRMPGIYDNQWHHIVFAYDEATSAMKIYKDGTLFKTLTWTGHGRIRLALDKVKGFYLGGKCVSGWGQSWLGGLDQFRLYGKVLTDAEVATLYSNHE